MINLVMRALIKNYTSDDIFRNADFSSIFQNMGFGGDVFEDILGGFGFGGGSSRSRGSRRGQKYSI